jgi:hypothetical protein
MKRLICYKAGNRYALASIDKHTNATCDGTIIDKYWHNEDGCWKDQDGASANVPDFVMVQQYSLLKNRLQGTSFMVNRLYNMKGVGDIVVGVVESGVIKPLMKVTFFDEFGEMTASGTLPQLSSNPLEQPFYQAGYKPCKDEIKEIALEVKFADDARPHIGNYMICE